MHTLPTYALWPRLVQVSTSTRLDSVWIVAKYTAVVVPESRVDLTHLGSSHSDAKQISR